MVDSSAVKHQHWSASPVLNVVDQRRTRSGTHLCTVRRGGPARDRWFPRPLRTVWMEGSLEREWLE
jgi:hypothetical protein